MRSALACLLVCASGCGEPEHTVAVQVQTDFAPGVEFTVVESRLYDGIDESGTPRLVSSPVFTVDDVRRPHPVGEIAGVLAGEKLLVVTLLDADGGPLAARHLLVRVGDSSAFTAVISRSCRDVDCPGEACVAGRCVPLDCGPDNPGACGEADCVTASDCAQPPADCAEVVCSSEGACLAPAASGACGEEEYCDPEEGCRTFEPPAPSSVLATSAPRFQTTSNGFVSVPGGSLTIRPTAPGETWLALISAQVGSDAELDDHEMEGAELRYLVDGVVRGQGDVQNATADGLAPFMHFDVLEGLEGPAELKVELRNRSAGTATLADLHVVALAVPAGADLQRAESDEPLTISTPDFASVLDATISPSSAGEYLVLVGFFGSEAPGGSGIDLRVLDPTGATWPRSWSNLRRPAQPFFAARRVALSEGPQTVSVQGRVRASDTGTMTYARVAALRTDAFDGLFAGETFTTITTSDAAPQPVTTLGVDAPPAEADHVCLASAVLDTDCNADPGVRNVTFDFGGETLSFAHAHGSCGYRPSYGGFRLVRSASPMTLQTSLSSSDGTVVESRDSTIYVLRLGR